MKILEIALLSVTGLFISACDAGGSGTSTPPVAAPGETLISDVQGTGDVSPLADTFVTVSAIVTGDFQDNDADTENNLGGFYVQQETPDSDARTSEGVFVFDGSRPSTDVRVGDRVTVAGTVKEFFGETQIDATDVHVTGAGIVPASDVSLPAAGITTNSDGDTIADLERYEGMLIRFSQSLTVANLRGLGRFGEVGLAQGGRPFQFTNGNAPDARAYSTYRESLAAASLTLDDGKRSENPAAIRFLTAGAAADYSIRSGDTVTGITGNLRYSRGSGGNGNQTWRLMPTKPVQFENDNPRPGAPSLGGSIRVASFNVLNFFSTIDTGQPVCGPQRDQNCRGADSSAELTRQLNKTASALALMDADIVGLLELENNASASVASIVNALNSRIGGGLYAYVDSGTVHDDAIKTAFIYKSSSVRPSGDYALLTTTADARFDENRNRPPLAQTFEIIDSGARVTVIVNHLKSKGSSCDSDGDPNSGDGQGNCNGIRTNAAAAIADWIKTDPTASDDPDFLIIGDLNAYLMEDPLSALKNAGLTNLIEATADPYSFVFDAQAGALDHALATSSLLPQVIATVEWHINADEPPLLDYNLEHGRDAALFDASSPYRASDHDPVIVGLELTN